MDSSVKLIKQQQSSFDDKIDTVDAVVVADDNDKSTDKIQNDQDEQIKSLPPEPPPLQKFSPVDTSTPMKKTTVVSKDPKDDEQQQHQEEVDEDDTTKIKSPSASLVAIRRMMFDSYNKDTDDAKLINNNKKDLSDINYSSSQKLLINKFNVNNNNNNNKPINKDNLDGIITKTNKDINNDDDNNVNVSDIVNNTLEYNLYKSNTDKSLPISKISDSVDVVLEANDKEDEKEVESIALHTDSVCNQKDLVNNDLEIKETIENEAEEAEENEEKLIKSSENLTKEIEKPIKIDSIEYPDDLNPFGDEEDEEDKIEEEVNQIKESSEVKKSTNPFGSDSDDDDEENLENIKESDKLLMNNEQKVSTMHKSPSLNPFGSDDEDEDGDDAGKKPVPLPRKNLLSPEPVPFPRSRLRGSLRSINSFSSTCSLPSPRKKKPAPQPPSSPSSTLSRSPRPRKLKRAPQPPSKASSIQSLQAESSSSVNNSTMDLSTNDAVQSKAEENKTDIAKEITTIVGMISDMATTNDDDSALPKDDTVLETSTTYSEEIVVTQVEESPTKPETSTSSKPEEESSRIPTPVMKKKLITLPKMDFDDSLTFIDVIPPPNKESDPNESIGDLSSGNYSYISDSTSLNNSYCDSLASPPSEKKNKDSANMHRKISEGGSIYSSKSSHGQWRRKKAPAPPLPLPKRRPVQAMPIQNIRQELHDIEIKQQGLERQGVALENKIRDKFDSESTITPYVEELVLQLFELVNEKNELFRKQAELMYLRRQHHLEEEYAELEYQIRCLMARPEANKTDSDKELEEQLIQRLVDVVERRDAIVQCLEMDRLREAEEDKSINTQLGIFTLAMAKEVKLISKKKHKKSKDKHNSLKMMDLDKDVDESDREINKKRKKWFTLQHIKGKHS
ncbi:hypothetical protein O3M35_010863 [Rhynocoris fuscipes]|uniref:BMERB domain-containing protein n=1 Tax=Rhynocoris fuscipes TaxID=488301 RepID=A0AAW1D483_9HEMI